MDDSLAEWLVGCWVAHSVVEMDKSLVELWAEWWVGELVVEMGDCWVD